MNIHENMQHLLLTQLQPMHLPSPRNLFKWVCLLPLVSVASCCFPALCPSSGAWWKCWHRKSDVHLSISSSFRLVLFPPRVGIQETSSFPREILVFNSKIQQKNTWNKCCPAVALAPAVNNFQPLSRGGCSCHAPACFWNAVLLFCESSWLLPQTV